jgi:hypothetical protein
MWKMVDSYLSKAELGTLARYTLERYPSFLDINNLPTKQEYNLDTCTLVEQWHNNPKYGYYPTEHLDKDEPLWEETGKVRLPLCSAILYVMVDNLVGANLEVSKDNIPIDIDYMPEFKNVDTIVPEEGKIVLLDPGVWHKVTDYVSGRRIALILNFWDEPLYSS